MAPVRGHLPPARIGVVCGGDGREEHLGGRHAQRQAEGAVAVVGIEPVIGRPQHPAGGDEDRFVPRPGDLEEDLVLAFELDLFVVQPPGQVHDPVDVEQVGLGEDLLGGSGLGAGAGRHR